MAGRGKSILQALKEKKEREERERSVSPSATRVPLPSDSTQSSSSAASATAAPGRGVGRGQLAALLASRQSSQAKTPSPPPPPQVTEEPGAQYLYYSADKAARPIPKRLSPVEPLPEVGSTLASSLPKTSSLETASTTQSAMQAEASATEPSSGSVSKLASRGRGLMLGRGMLPASSKREESPGPRRPPPPQEAAVAAAQVESKLSKLTLVEEIKQPTTTAASRRSDDGQQTVLTSSTGTGTGTGLRQSVMQTVITESSTNTQSIVKAEEELQVIEHIQRKSPVRRMGEVGDKCDFVTNYIKLSCNNRALYQYQVYFSPPIDSTHHRIKMVYVGLGNIIGPARLFDGVVLFLPILLKDKTTVVNMKRKLNNIEQDVEIKIVLTKILPPEQIPSPVFNIIFKNIMKELQMTRIGQHYFSPARQIDVSKQNLQIWPGYTTAVHEFEDGLYLVTDVAHKVLRTQTCWHIMDHLYRESNNDLTLFRQAVTKTLVGSIVLTKYNNRTYRVDDILWDQNPMVQFKYHDNKMISYVQYYKEHYDIDIRDTGQPLLFHRPKAKQKTGTNGGNGGGNGGSTSTDVICLVPELCFMTGLSEEMRADFNVKKDLSVHTRLSPEDRYKQLKALVDSIRNNPKAYEEVRKWGLDLEQGINRMQGRVLPSEKIIFARREVDTDYKCDWTRAAGNEEVISAIEIKNWMCVYPGNKENIVARFCELAYESGRKIGIRIAEPMIVPLKDDRPDTYYNEIKKRLDENVQVVVVILPMLSDNRYQRVKRLCCIEYPVPSQVIVVKTINKPDQSLRSIAQKIVLQMNVKLGGELWRLAIPIKRIMIVGIDVYHKIEKGFKSIAGFVSSLNQDQTRWYSKVCFQMVGQELADTFKATFMCALKKYNEVNGFLPDKIFVFRDGVSEGQLPIVSEHEVNQMRSCFTADYSPQMCVIVVQKRISTRIFATNPSGSQAFSNPKPGSVIDYGITSKEHYDFFLVSQNVNQGTVTPTHYIVAYDDTKMKPDYVQRLSYKMTHMYYNWSGTIRVPAPCQYAHKLAFLTGQYLQEEAHEALCNRLFYL